MLSAKESRIVRHPFAYIVEGAAKLDKSGFLVSEYGTNGGYKLARDPGITALEVIRAIDGPIVLTAVFHRAWRRCDQSGPLHRSRAAAASP